MRQIAEATWVCGDPGMQFDTTVNDWHTCPNTARINASNPCSEYMFLDDSACNLASINLMKFVDEDGEFNVESFERACATFLTAQEILVDNASYPTKSIERNSHDYRPLGLGYANLGALLMSRGLPYDSDAGRDYAAAITAVMHGAGVRPVGAHRARSRRAVPRLRSRTASRCCASCASTARRSRTSTGRTCRSRSSRPPSGSGTSASSSASSTAIATRRPPCSRRPARSAS